MLKSLTATWVDRGVWPSSPPNPDFPRGVDIDVSNGAGVSCQTQLPYPAKRCGHYLVECSLCGVNAVITTAGRPDDPRSVRIACRRQEGP